ncbi:probable tubulin polyglutamylase ttll-15 [Pectinophora gossypiella]|uniref:probable tubulin polyglutamylase ttll-15 n=1 Tax=Pectinophora gossypiella TaxID=13191 RepID=UPI00214EC72D|nr:probable tubulin polyglutamylase ttll-15 [Pectinophora gossypiella]
MADIELKRTEKQEIPEKDSNANDIEEDEHKNKKETIRNSNKNVEKSTYLFFLVCILGLIFGIALEIVKVGKDTKDTKPKYWVYSARQDVDSREGLLKHVHLVLGRLGWEKSTNATPWDLLWSHDWPFTALAPHLYQLQPHQRVNHFPGTGFITNKVDLATSESKYIPKAFRLPKNKEEFLKYAVENKDVMFVEKNNQHRGVVLKNVSQVDLASGDSFVQEYLQRPFLVDGHKFDIGVYVVLTSVDPLRAYWYKGDILFRFCTEKYYPFDPRDLNKYVVGDDYLPAWKVPSLSRAYSTLGLSVKDAFDIYARSQGKDPDRMWEEVQQSIAEVLLAKERHVVQALKEYRSRHNFFELMRFDLVVDEELQVYLLEANMSPNLSSAHFAQNRLLYEQVLYGTFSLVGVASPLNGYRTDDASEKAASASMVSSDKNIAVWGAECGACGPSCAALCGLCAPCARAAKALRPALAAAHREHTHRADFRRLYPPAMKPNTPPPNLANLTPMNRLQHLWYQGKCNIDITWCS